MKTVKTFLTVLSVSILALACTKKDFDTVINRGPVNQQTEPNILPTTIKIGTYNVWEINNGNKYEGYEWSVRKDRLAQSMVNNSFDICGIQEFDETIKAELPEAVKKKAGKDIYEWYFYKTIGFLYNKERLEVSEPVKFALSDNPDNSNSTCWDGYSRHCLYMVVTDKDTDKKFALMVTHGPLNNNEYRVRMAELVTEREKTYNTDGLPVFFAGDMNMVSTEQGYELLRENDWLDCYHEAPLNFVYGPVGTFNGHKTSTDLTDPKQRIDYIFLKDPDEKIEVATYRCDNGRFDNDYYPSDHCPVSVQMNIL